MIIVDSALEKREQEGNPIRVAMVGAGNIGRGIAYQIENHCVGMKLVAIGNRTLTNAETAYKRAGVDAIQKVDTVDQLEDAISRGHSAITSDAFLLCEANSIDAIIEATGEVEFGAHLTMKAIDNKKHIILMNAELDATVGPLLKYYADRAGVVVTNADGDQPGVIMNLFRWVKGAGYNPVLAGNMKGLQDHYRTPETQKGFAEKNELTAKMATSFADGTKISMENAVVANATGFKVGRRGMYGPKCKHVTEAANLFPTDQLLEGGLVDYILGAEPGPGVFILGHDDNPKRKLYMRHLKMGDGPLYVFYIPYHLPHLEVASSVARAVLFNDATIAPIAGPVCDVITIAKRDLKSDTILDGIGGFDSYGTIENIEESLSQNYLPMGLSGGCRLKRDVAKDVPITLEDVQLPAGRLCDKLWFDQKAHFFQDQYHLK